MPVRIIDCQSHLFPPVMLEYLLSRAEPPRAYRQGNNTYVVVGKWIRRVLPRHTDVALKLADMDAAQIAMAALSINDPGPEFFGSDGLMVARLCNDYIGGLVRQYPARFFGMAVLPLQNMAEALAELERCRDNLGMKGILLYSNLNGKFPDEAEFRPLFHRAEALGMPLFLHPAYPATYDAVQGYEMAAGLGLMFDTTIALTGTILSGILDECPRLKLVCPHVGGALPYLIGRIDHQTQVLRRGAGAISKPPSEYLRGVYLDTVTPLPEAVRYAFDFVGPDRLLFGTDHPWVDPQLIANNIRSLNLGPEVEAKIFGGNARELFQL